MTLEEAMDVAATGQTGAVQIDQPWVARSNDRDKLFPGQPTTNAPGLVDLDYLRSMLSVREWRPEDAR